MPSPLGLNSCHVPSSNPAGVHSWKRSLPLLAHTLPCLVLLWLVPGNALPHQYLFGFLNLGFHAASFIDSFVLAGFDFPLLTQSPLCPRGAELLYCGWFLSCGFRRGGSRESCQKSGGRWGAQSSAPGVRSLCVPVTFDCCLLFSLGRHPPRFPAYPLFICSFDLKVVTAPADTDSRWPCYGFPRLKPRLTEVPPSANSLASNSLIPARSLLPVEHFCTQRPSAPPCRGPSLIQVPE